VVVERERARTEYLAEREGVVRMVRATELPWFPEAPKMAMVDLDILGEVDGGGWKLWGEFWLMV
jgi:hypothetical protein